MRFGALLQSLPAFQISLAIHAVLGVALYVAVPGIVHEYAANHTYAVSLFHHEPDLASIDESEDAEEEETLCIERDEPEDDAGVYDGPPEMVINALTEKHVDFEPVIDVFDDLEPAPHDHVWVTYGRSGSCAHCSKPTSWKMRCSHPGCTKGRFGGHRCLVATSSGLRPATKGIKAPVKK